MEQREHGGVRANADRKREDRGDRENRLLDERAQAVTDVGEERFEPDEQIALADVLVLHGVVAEATARLEAGGFGRSARGGQFVGAFGEMEREFAIDVVSDLAGAEDVDQACDPGHGGLYAFFNTRWTPVHSRVQLSSSSANSFRPALVMV